MKQLYRALPLFFLFTACAGVAPAPEIAEISPPRPEFSFRTSAADSHFIELREWAERNGFEASTDAHRSFQVLVVGCAGNPECFFVHEGAGPTRIFEPRLKKDWTTTLEDETLAERVRQMTCESSPAIGEQDLYGECRVLTLERTRADLRSTPEIARLMTELERSPAIINIIKKRKK